MWWQEGRTIPYVFLSPRWWVFSRSIVLLFSEGFLPRSKIWEFICGIHSFPFSQHPLHHRFSSSIVFHGWSPMAHRSQLWFWLASQGRRIDVVYGRGCSDFASDRLRWFVMFSWFFFPIFFFLNFCLDFYQSLRWSVCSISVNFFFFFVSEKDDPFFD